jgi:DNA polymerase-3 subunit alpha
MKPNDFVHLHVHSHFSLLDGNCQIAELLDTVQNSGQDAMALTDHGNLFGAIPFYRECRKREIKPILGIEAYIASDSRHDRKKVLRPGHNKSTYHATLLATSRQGFENLIQLSSAAYVEGFYYKPRMDRAILREFSKDIICLSGCLAGEVNQSILAGRMEEAEKTIREYQEIFGSENFYLEVMAHGIPEEDQARAAMRELSSATGVPLVATNDIHYIRADDWKAQDVALCIGTGKTEADPNRFKMSTHELYFKDTATMANIFVDMPRAIASTREIADRLVISRRTAEHHVQHVYTKIGVSTRPGATLFALEHGLIP